MIIRAAIGPCAAANGTGHARETSQRHASKCASTSRAPSRTQAPNTQVSVNLSRGASRTCSAGEEVNTSTGSAPRWTTSPTRLDKTGWTTSPSSTGRPSGAKQGALASVVRKQGALEGYAVGGCCDQSTSVHHLVDKLRKELGYIMAADTGWAVEDCIPCMSTGLD